VEDRAQRESGVGHPSGDDDIGTAAQRLHDRCHAEVGVGRQHPVADLGERAAGFHVRQRMTPGDELVEATQDVVTRHQPNPDLPPEAEPAGHVEHRLRAAARIHAAGVRGDLDPALDDVRQDPLHQRHEVTRVPGARIARLLLLHDGHRHFGEVVHHQVVDGSTAHLPHGSLQPIAPEPLARGNPHHPLAHSSFLSAKPLSLVHT
jgi:hypothetical protein